MNGPAEIFVNGREGVYEASDYWQDGRLFCALGRWRLTRTAGPHYAGDVAVRKWPTRMVREIRDLDVGSRDVP
jgi:hypothetical protein